MVAAMQACGGGDSGGDAPAGTAGAGGGTGGAGASAGAGGDAGGSGAGAGGASGGTAGGKGGASGASGSGASAGTSGGAGDGGASGSGAGGSTGGSSGGGSAGKAGTGGGGAGGMGGDGGKAGGPPPVGGSGGDTNFQFVLGTTSFDSPDVAMPAKGAAAKDLFHTEITRITDAADGTYKTGIQNEYSRSDPENADGTRLILRANEGGFHLYDGAGKPVKDLSAIQAGTQEPEPRWDAKLPNVFYYLSGMELRTYDTNDDSSKVVHDFAADFPGGKTITTGSEGDASTDRRVFCLMVLDANAEPFAALSYDRTIDKVVWKQSGGFPDSIDWVSSDANGKHCVVGYADGDGDGKTPPFDSFPLDLAKKVSLPAGATGHADVALDADGKDVIVYQNVDTDYVAMADLTTGVETELVSIPFGTNSDIGLHFSGNAVGAPGWVLVSTYGSKNPPAGSNHSWMDNQVFMLELVANPRVWRIGHTHSFTSVNPPSDKAYFAEAFATINAKGNRVYFGSNWGDLSKKDYTDTYRIPLPSYWPVNMPKLAAGRPVIAAGARRRRPRPAPRARAPRARPSVVGRAPRARPG